MSYKIISQRFMNEQVHKVLGLKASQISKLHTISPEHLRCSNIRNLCYTENLERGANKMQYDNENTY